MSYIKIDENARMLVEDNNYVLEWKVKSGVRPDGTEPTKEFKWVLGGYFPELDALLRDYVKNAPSHQNQGKIKSLQDVVDCIREAEANVTKLIHK